MHLKEISGESGSIKVKEKDALMESGADGSRRERSHTLQSQKALQQKKLLITTQNSALVVAAKHSGLLSAA